MALRKTTKAASTTAAVEEDAPLVPTAFEVATALRTIANFFDAHGDFLSGGAPAAPAKKGSTKPAAVEEEDEEETEELDRDEVEAMSLTELRALAKQLDLEEQKAKQGILSELEENGYFGDSDADDDEDEDEELEEDDEDGDEEEGYSREELEEMDLKGLRAIAKSAGHSLADYKGLDQEGLIELILDESDEEDEDEEDDEDGEEEELTEESMQAMSVPELKKLAEELDVKLPRNMKDKGKIIETILDAAGEEEDEDDDEE